MGQKYTEEIDFAQNINLTAKEVFDKNFNSLKTHFSGDSAPTKDLKKGMIFFNETTNLLELYDGENWKELPSELIFDKQPLEFLSNFSLTDLPDEDGFGATSGTNLVIPSDYLPIFSTTGSLEISNYRISTDLIWEDTRSDFASSIGNSGQNNDFFYFVFGNLANGSLTRHNSNYNYRLNARFNTFGFSSFGEDGFYDDQNHIKLLTIWRNLANQSNYLGTYYLKLKIETDITIFSDGTFAIHSFMYGYMKSGHARQILEEFYCSGSFNVANQDEAISIDLNCFSFLTPNLNTGSSLGSPHIQAALYKKN